jgi:hypothetical protein
MFRYGLTGVSVLQPSPSQICILLIDNVLDVLRIFLNLVCHLNARQTSSDGQHLQLPRGRVLVPMSFAGLDADFIAILTLYTMLGMSYPLDPGVE